MVHAKPFVHELKQTTIYDVPDPSFNNKDYVQPAIYAKLDWLTAVYTKATVREVFTTVFCNMVDDIELDQAFSKRVQHSYGYATDLFINVNGVNFAFHMAEVNDKIQYADLANVEAFSFFELRFDYLRLDISGSGLDYLRSLGIKVDSHFRSEKFLGGEAFGFDLKFHLTRVDTAFDLVNYFGGFLDRQIEICRNCGNPDTLRIGLVGKNAGVAYSIREGDQKTLYLGTGRSDKLLRIYDKKLQYRKAGALGNCPYNATLKDGTVIVPDTWIRIELQCRRPEATSLVMFSADSFLDVFMWIKSNFAIRNEQNALDESWEELFDWAKCKTIIQNEYSVQFVPLIQRVTTWVENIAFSNIVHYVSEKGWDAFKNNINLKFARLQTSDNPIDQKRFTALLSRMLSDNLSLPDHIESDMGFLRLKD